MLYSGIHTRRSTLLPKPPDFCIAAVRSNGRVGYRSVRDCNEYLLASTKLMFQIQKSIPISIGTQSEHHTRNIEQKESHAGRNLTVLYDQKGHDRKEGYIYR